MQPEAQLCRRRESGAHTPTQTCVAEPLSRPNYPRRSPQLLPPHLPRWHRCAKEAACGTQAPSQPPSLRSRARSVGQALSLLNAQFLARQEVSQRGSTLTSSADASVSREGKDATYLNRMRLEGKQSSMPLAFTSVRPALSCCRRRASACIERGEREGESGKEWGESTVDTTHQSCERRRELGRVPC